MSLGGSMAEGRQRFQGEPFPFPAEAAGPPGETMAFG